MTKKEVYNEYLEACKDIAVQCEEEGYPSHGSNYEIRCQQLWDEYYSYEMDDAEDDDEEPKVKMGRKLRAPSREYRRNCKVKDRIPTKGTSCFRKGYHKYEKQWKEECRRTARRDAKKQCRI